MKKLWLLLLAVLLGCAQADPGERLVFARFGKVDQTCYKEGLYFYNPITWDAYELDVKVRRYEVKTGAASHDLQDVKATVVLNFSVDGNNCHDLIQQVGQDFIHRKIGRAHV